MLISCLTIVVIFYCLGLLISPFPHWNTYFKLWQNVLLNPTPLVPFYTRVTQATILFQYAVKASVFGYLWQLDKLIYPKYLDQEIKAIFIIGEPRSGTTFLHRTMGGDETSFYAIRHIEWRYPFIIVQKLIYLFGLENWLRRINYWPNNSNGKEASKMHQNTLFDFEEDGIFFEECFLFHFFTLFRFPYDNLFNYLDAFDSLSLKQQMTLLQTHYQVIQKIGFLRGSDKIYLSKEVTSHSKFKHIRFMYPHARFIVNLRSSNQFMSSLLRIIRISILCKTNIDKYAGNSRFKSMLIERMQKDCELLLDFSEFSSCNEHILNERHCICMTYSQLMQEPRDAIQYLYWKFNLKITPLFLEHLHQIQAEQKHRKRDYDYEPELFEGFERFDQLVEQCSKQRWAAPTPEHPLYGAGAECVTTK